MLKFVLCHTTLKKFVGVYSMKNKIVNLVTVVISLILITAFFADDSDISRYFQKKPKISYDLRDAEYDGKSYIEINGNTPDFSNDEITEKSFESYSELDNLNRCGVAFACIGRDIMPTEPRGRIGMVKPSGWHIAKYDIVDGKYLYNRCHLIGYQLSGENANEKNLITGTRYMNTIGMLPFENVVADYVEETGNHVMYRVTPFFEDDNLVAKGVHMEAYSVEDNGTGVSFNIFVFNIQPGIEINYANGESRIVGNP